MVWGAQGAKEWRMTATERDTVQALLAWYAAMGADEAIGEVAVDRFAVAGAPSPSPPRVQPRPRPAAARSETSPASGAGADPSAAASLAALEAMLAGFDGCALKRTAKRLCFARGSEEARIMLIGEAPGREEDIKGKPFVGPAGQLLDRMLAAIGLAEEQVYITNTIYWRPPGNRAPTPEEVQACAPFLARQIELKTPQVLVLLGGAAAKNILGVAEGIMRLRGKWLNHASGGRDIPTLATLHPAFLLRNPEQKRLAWRDLLAVKERLEQ
jgi:DNA polymerase